MFTLFVFLMADITAMHKTTAQDIWIPKSMSDSSTPPRISSFADAHAPALLYAELLRKYTSGSLMASAVSSMGHQWYKDRVTSGYFCRHGGFISFVQGPQTLKDDQKKLDEILASYEQKYKATDWTLPAVATIPTTAFVVAVSQKEPAEKRLQQLLEETKREKFSREKALQSVADILEHEGTLTIAALLKVDKELHERDITIYREKTTLFGLNLLAAPHIRSYHGTISSSRAFLYNNVFIVFDVFSLADDSDMLLFRPHAFLAYKDGLTEAQYEKSVNSFSLDPWIQFPKIFSTVGWSGGLLSQFETANIILHGPTSDILMSTQAPEIGKLVDVFRNGPFVTEITQPEKYKVKTLHFLSKYKQGKELPSTPEELIRYFEQLQLSLKQQKFIIEQLFPFLQV